MTTTRPTTARVSSSTPASTTPMVSGVVEEAEHRLHHADRHPLQQRQAEHRPEQRQRRLPGGPGRRRGEALAQHGLQADPGQDRGQPDQELLQQQQAEQAHQHGEHDLRRARGGVAEQHPQAHPGQHVRRGTAGHHQRQAEHQPDVAPDDQEARRRGSPRWSAVGAGSARSAPRPAPAAARGRLSTGGARTPEQCVTSGDRRTGRELGRQRPACRIGPDGARADRVGSRFEKRIGLPRATRHGSAAKGTR